MPSQKIIDIGFLGLFPKKIYHALHKYGRELERVNTTASYDYFKLVDNLITAFIYRLLTVQKVVHILLAQW